MRKTNVCVLFGGMSQEHEVSLHSAQAVLKHLDTERYNIYPVGITKSGNWMLYGSDDYSKISTGEWQSCTDNRKATISPIRGQGLLSFEGDCVVRERIDVVFPVLHGENGEDGCVQGLLQLAGIPAVGSRLSACAAAMDKCVTKLIAAHIGTEQAAWLTVTRQMLAADAETVLNKVERELAYPVIVKTARTCPVGAFKASNREALQRALSEAIRLDSKLLVEQSIIGHAVEVAVLGNSTPVASCCGERITATQNSNYEAKHPLDGAQLCVPANISEQAAEQVREEAIRVYQALGCRGLARVDFFVTDTEEKVVLNKVQTIPYFTASSMYPKLFAADDIPFGRLIDELLALAMETEDEA